MSAAPEPPERPLYVEAVHGLRVWQVVGAEEGRPMLAAQAARQVWPPGETMRAICLAGNPFRRPSRKEDEPHLAPARGCGCGIYALHPGKRLAISLAERILARPGPDVAGVVSAWGRVEVHLSGFRAEYACPSILFVRGDDDRADLVRQLGEEYGARVVEATDREMLRGFVESELRGIPPEVASELVVKGLELRLAPAMETFIGSSDEPVASSGYRIDPDSDLDLEGQPVRIPGFSLFPVVGASFRREALQDPAFAPGRTVSLVPEPDNPADPGAIAVWDEERRVQVGYVPRERLRRVRPALEAGRIRRAIVVWQYRGMNTGERSGLRILTSPTERIRIREPACGEQYWGNNDDIPF